MTVRKSGKSSEKMNKTSSKTKPVLRLSDKELTFIYDLIGGMSLNKAQDKEELGQYSVALLAMKINAELERRQEEEEKIEKMERLAEQAKRLKNDR